MKHEIEIPDLPEGWESVEAMIDPDGSYFGDDGNQYANAKIKLKKKQPRRIVLEEIGECTDNSHNHTIYVKGITIDIYSNKLWKIVEDDKCA